MRIYGPNATPIGAPAPGARRATGSGFSLPDASETSEVRATVAPRSVGSIDALLALQGVEDPAERRKRSVKRGRQALDVLDELKIQVLGGDLSAATLARLRGAAAELKAGDSGDPGLDAVLAEIEVRVEVELAKAARAGGG